VRTGGQLVVEQFLAEGVDRVFCVPGESYLAVLDALYDAVADIGLVSCRHESGAAMMAAATGHLTDRPGVAFVTRGPGATNASIAVHVARQASIPLVLGVGQVTMGNLGRESFQEVDLEAYFRPIAKQVRQVEAPDLIPEAVAEAFAIARQGRHGPVVLAFPQDVLSARTSAEPAPSRRPEVAAIDPTLIVDVERYLARAERPLIVVGGGDWDDNARRQLHAFAGERDIPVAAAFRHADIFDNQDPRYVGFLGFNTHQALWERVENADCLLVIGARLDEPTTRNYRILEERRRDQSLIHLYPDPAQLGRNFVADLEILATVKSAMGALSKLPLPASAQWKPWREAARADYLCSEVRPGATGALDPGAIMDELNAAIPADAIVTIDAGDFTVWPQRYRRYTRPGRQIAPINGAMGYGVPAAIAASLAHPDRTVVGCVGDGGMLMTGMELATAVKYGATPIICVFNNNKYGTIDTHQRRKYPGRPIGNELTNPDFAAFAESFGAFGIRVERSGDFPAALERARAAGRVAVIELLMDAKAGEGP
jgi:acetolactate synthase-1/2/3 large subunit